MGIGRVELQFLLNEHKYRPITGEVLAIGRQNTDFTEEAADYVLGMHGIKRRAGAKVMLDADTQHGNQGKNLSDHSLMSFFSDCKYYAADISEYEGADFIFDICGEVPAKLKGRFDFVLDGGSLDNVFDPLAMMRNMASMLKPGGRLFLTPWINSHQTAYVKLSPDWVMDYFAVNEWADAKVYLLVDRLPGGGLVSMWQYDPATAPNTYQTAAITAVNRTQLFAVAELGAKSTINRTAIQQHYRGTTFQQPYVDSAARFAASRRPTYVFPSLSAPGVEPISARNAMRHIGTSRS